ncbi:hypothetical protein CHY_0486 [Carboxydothermus hydrogenoformans Z-2901]|uniref:Uncharacterized protein n=1 Tax=Carboxydothermus hydrogenoformans (strain ATCC BAA-161 / DSM 6008 / Z-2901) TaxID=246194 RepID=Q3AEU0_CARHZ|nr:hypothetical protein CHY_0486 [Carboxydothermus hydrogenoformans Z-2901]
MSIALLLLIFIWREEVGSHLTPEGLLRASGFAVHGGHQTLSSRFYVILIYFICKIPFCYFIS